MTFWKEPFFHFALMGAGIFLWFSLANPEAASAPEDNEIVITEQVVATLRAQYLAKLNRPPTVEEASVLIDRYVRDEMLMREALAMGLDQGDGIVRNRLVQKMGFLSTSAAQSAVPDAATLQAHLDTNAERFARAAQASFEQVLFTDAATDADVSEVLTALSSGQNPPQDVLAGYLPPVVADATQSQIDGAFGTGFFDALSDFPPHTWAGPVQSGFGRHLVRVDEITPPEVPELSSIYDKVLADWRSELADDLRDAQENAMMAGYVIERPDADTLAQWLSQ